jgi:hypothetical protein
MKKTTALPGLLLLPVFFLLHSYNQLFGFVPLKTVLFYLFVIYGVLAAFYLIMLRLKITAPKTSLILFAVFFFILFFAPLHDGYRAITFGSIVSRYWVMLPLFCLLLLLLARKIIIAKNISPKIFSLLNLMMAGVLATELFIAFTKAGEYKKNHNLIYPQKPLTEKYVSPNLPDSSKPDIYFLLFDEYTNNKALKKIWGYDNSQITDWLAKNDFYIPSDTRCNYSFTVFSISSTFNMDYIDKKMGWDGTNDFNMFKAQKSLSNNETFSILKKEDYLIRFLAPFNNSIENNGLEYYFDFMLDELIPNQTLPGSLGVSVNWGLKLKDSLNYNRYLNRKYQYIRLTADEVKNTTDSSSNRKPHFVYGHFLITHEPHVFDSTGKIMTLNEFLSTDYYNTYTAQVNYANTVIKELVEHIRQHNKPNTIIIIEGDHGFRHFTDSLNNPYSLSNFTAIYFPDKNYSKLYDTMTPVNIFRVLFDQYFHQNFPLLKDRSTVVKDHSDSSTVIRDK